MHTVVGLLASSTTHATRLVLSSHTNRVSVLARLYMDKIKVRSATASTYSFYRVYDLRASPLGSKVVPGGFILLARVEYMFEHVLLVRPLPRAPCPVPLLCAVCSLPDQVILSVISDTWARHGGKI